MLDLRENAGESEARSHITVTMEEKWACQAVCPGTLTLREVGQEAQIYGVGLCSSIEIGVVNKSMLNMEVQVFLTLPHPSPSNRPETPKLLPILVQETLMTGQEERQSVY